MEGANQSLDDRLSAIPLVSVIIPAYNAAATLQATLESVAAQDYTNFEVVVVNDGSKDATGDIADKFAASDSRFRILHKTNGGVAAARNLAIAETRGDFIATLDADDLWRADKLSAQVAAFQAGGPEVGMVYTWTVLIDTSDRPIRTYTPRLSGHVLSRLCAANIINNGSTPMFRRQAILEAGGYDPTLRAVHAEGCEDWKLYSRVAAKYEVRVIQDFLTFYRIHAYSLSSDVMQMMRSHEMVSGELLRDFPQHRNALRRHAINLLMGLLLRTLSVGDWAQSRTLLRMMFERHPSFATFMLLAYPAKRLIRAFQRLDAHNPAISIRRPTGQA
jgi:glycosyltransferase involved in cell wall biosynthesis